jgi:hypothetical protein
LGSWGHILLESGQPSPAADCFFEGAKLLRPFVAAMPAAFAGLFEALVSHGVRALNAAGREDEIEPILAALGVRLESGDEDGP